MGVRGLVAFVQKTCPNVVEKLRLSSLRGKTIVIDATLITQRFHFAAIPHRHRHVLGWFRLVRDLRAHNVHAICVFDSKERSAAKSGEVKRRRETRRIDSARGLIERDRLHRFSETERLLAAIRELGPAQKHEALLHFKRYLSEIVSAPLLDLTALQKDDPSLSDFFPTTELGLFSQDDINDVLQSCNSFDSGVDNQADIYIGDELIPSSRPIDDESADQTVNPLTLVADDDFQDFNRADFLDTPNFTITGNEASSLPTDIASVLATFYTNYIASVKTLRVLSTSPRSGDDTKDDMSMPGADHDSQVQSVSMSRAQIALAHDEGAFWRTLAEPEADFGADIAALSAIKTRSAVMAQSYLRRASPPTEETYDDSRAILHAMGVPVIMAPREVEAEALASSIVLHGFADYVASEDTDVIVYQAPLLRGIASRYEQLTLIPAGAFSSALGLSKKTFVDFAILLGTDFAPRVRGIGPVRALQLLRTHLTIEEAFAPAAAAAGGPTLVDSNYLSAVHRTRQIFETLPTVPPLESLAQRTYSSSDVIRVLTKYNLLRRAHVADDSLDGSTSLEGNYFGDDPSVSTLQFK